MPRKLDRAAACQSWAPYVRYVADQLWLRDWTILINDEAPDAERAVAQVYPTEGQRRATISFADGFLDEDDEKEQRQTVAHELIHLHLEMVRMIAERALGEKHEDFRLALEYAIDGLADAFAEKLLLPSQVESVADEE